MDFTEQLRTAEQMERKGLISDVITVVDDPRAIMGLDFRITTKGFDRARVVYAAMTIADQILVRAYLAELEKEQGNTAV